MSRLMKIGKFVLPRSRLACCFLRGNGCGRGPTRKMLFRKHSFAFGGATIRLTPEPAGVERRRGVSPSRVASQPDGPAAAAGVQQNDIIKMLNDQILINPNQLSKLVRSFSEGTNVTLIVLRKGQEQKITVKLTKKEVPERWEFGPGHHEHSGFPFGDQGFGALGEQFNNLKDQLGDAKRGMIHDAVMKAHEEARRTRDEARRAVQDVRILTRDNGALKATRIDIGKAQIVFSDEKGEMKVEAVDGKKLLTAKDPQGKLLFSGPVETKADLDKLPPEVRERYDKLQQHDLPAVAPRAGIDNDDDSADANDDEDEAPQPSLEQVSLQWLPHKAEAFRTGLM